MKSTLRNLKIGDAAYQYRVHSRKTAVIFTAFLKGSRAPIRYVFAESGFPEREGVISDNGWTINLWRPGVAALLIRFGIEAGWQPAPDSRKEFVIDDGLEFLRSRRTELDGVIE